MIVVDFESTCWENSWEKQDQEIIEFGAVKLDLKNRIITDSFQALVKPRNNPKLSEYCINLTRIQQAEINKAQSFKNIANRFNKWCGSKNAHILASWGRDDLILQKECFENGIEWKLSKDHINIAFLFREKYTEENEPKYSLERALKLLGIPFEGQPHRALNDAAMTAKLMLKITGDD